MYPPEPGSGIAELPRSCSSAFSAVLLVLYWSFQQFFTYCACELILKTKLEHISSGHSHKNTVPNLWTRSAGPPGRWRSASERGQPAIPLLLPRPGLEKSPEPPRLSVSSPLSRSLLRQSSYPLMLFLASLPPA